MKPTTKDKYVGIEIECILPRYNKEDHDLGGYHTQSEVIRGNLVLLGVKDKVEVGYDNSIKGNEHPGMFEDNPDYSPDDDDCCEEPEILITDVGVEVRVLCKESELIPTMSKVCFVLNRMNAYVNETCGLHVHLDMRERDYAICGRRLLDMQQAMQHLVHPSRLKNKYCKALTDREFDEYIEDPESSELERYRDINLRSMEDLQTVEVRVHEGTINFNTIVSWVTWLVRVVDNKPLLKWEKEYVNRRGGVGASRVNSSHVG